MSHSIDSDPRPLAACALLTALALGVSAEATTITLAAVCVAGLLGGASLLPGIAVGARIGAVATATIAAGAGLLSAGPLHPMRALAIAVLGTLPLLPLLRPSQLERLDRSCRGAPLSSSTRDAAVAAALAVPGIGLMHFANERLASAALASMPLVVVAAAVRTTRLGARDRMVLTLLPLSATCLLAAGSITGEMARPAVLASMLLLAASALAGRRMVHGGGDELTAETLLSSILSNPARTLVSSFAVLCLLGTVLLEMPGASTHGERIPWLDAAFTAVSATCVTGLATLDTPNAFSGFGELLILLLFQIGGLGIMVFSAAAFVVLGRRMSLSHEAAAVEMVGAEGRSDLRGALQRVLVVTAVTESAAALLLTGAFWLQGETPGQALWRGMFTAVSAFCNAGFALQSDSLMGYAQQPFVLAVVGLTIVIGGLGPSVVAATVLRQRGWFSLHVRIVLLTSALLTVIPAFLFAAFEWNATLSELPPVHRVSNALFQSVTLRTAGFNSVDLAAVAPATWTLMLPLMFIGGSPGSTAGGIKTTTFALLVLAATATIRGRTRIELAGRRIPTRLVLRAIALTGVSLATVAITTVMLQLGGTMSTELAVFESFSAVGTVGLSMGGTAKLDGVGKVVIMLAMFAGRVGPLTLFAAFALSPERPRHRLPNESVPLS